MEEKLKKCGEEFFLVCTCCTALHRAEKACNLKWCPCCARRRSAQRVSKYQKAAALMKWPLHVTLTVTNYDEINPAIIRNLKRNVVRLRRTPLFVKTVLGGIVSIELTNKGRGWHPHAHLLIDCEWLSLKTKPPTRKDSRERKAAKCKAASQELERAWSKIIGQFCSSIAVRRCSGDTAVREVLKYAVKPGDLIDSPDAIGPAIRAITGTRLSTPFGSLYGMKKELQDDPKVPFACPTCGELNSLMPEEVAERLMKGSGSWRA